MATTNPITNSILILPDDTFIEIIELLQSPRDYYNFFRLCKRTSKLKSRVDKGRDIKFKLWRLNLTITRGLYVTTFDKVCRRLGDHHLMTYILTDMKKCEYFLDNMQNNQWVITDEFKDYVDMNYYIERNIDEVNESIKAWNFWTTRCYICGEALVSQIGDKLSNSNKRFRYILNIDALVVGHITCHQKYGFAGYFDNNNGYSYVRHFIYRQLVEIDKHNTEESMDNDDDEESNSDDDE